MTTNNKQKRIFVSILVMIAIIGAVYLFETRKNDDPVPAQTVVQTSPEIIEHKITLIGAVKELNNTDPAQYYYELTLSNPFYDEIQPTGNPANKMPVLSRSKDLQDSIKGYVGKEVAMEGLMRWGQGESRYLEISTITDMSSWTIYTNKTFGYSLKLPTTYQVPPQTEKEKSQLGIDNNIVVGKLNSSTKVIIIDVYQDKENISLDDYVNQNSKQLGITGPLLSNRFNGNESLVNKNQPGINQFVKQGLYIYHITAPTASQDKEVADIVATFKFTQ